MTWVPTRLVPTNYIEKDEVLTLKSKGIVRVEGAKDRKWDVKLTMCECCADKPGTSRGCQVCSGLELGGCQCGTSGLNANPYSLYWGSVASQLCCPFLTLRESFV